jgi:hypothetical protein
MFFNKSDKISEDEIMRIGITAATMCHIVESRFPSRGIEGHIKYVNDSVDNVLKNLELKPNTDLIRNLLQHAHL